MSRDQVLQKNSNKRGILQKRRKLIARCRNTTL